MDNKKQRRINCGKLVKLFMLMGVVVGVALFASRYTVLRVSGNSMDPTYHDHQLLVARRGNDFEMDHPVCWVRLADGTNVVKRLIGRPGDIVSLIEGVTYVNDVQIMDRTTASWDNHIFVLGEDQYLFLGDNRADSVDGRYWPGSYVSRSQILAYVIGSDLPEEAGS